MDWDLFWTAAGVVIPLSALIIGFFRSTSKDLRAIAEPLSHLEGYIAGRDVGKRDQFKHTGTDGKRK